MPIIGTSTNVTSLDQLESLADSRLSIQKNEKGEDTIVATKGTLADGLYSIWAKCCPQQARDHNVSLMNAMKKTILTSYSETEKSIFENHLLGYDPSKNSTCLMGGKITVAQVLEAKNLKRLLPGTRFDSDVSSQISFNQDAIQNQTDTTNARSTQQVDPSVKELSLKKATAQEGAKIFEENLSKLPSEKQFFFRPILQAFAKDIFQLAQKNEKIDYFATLKEFNEKQLGNLSEMSFTELTKKCQEFKATLQPPKENEKKELVANQTTQVEEKQTVSSSLSTEANLPTNAPTQTLDMSEGAIRGRLKLNENPPSVRINISNPTPEQLQYIKEKGEKVGHGLKKLDTRLSWR
ncbi:MAG: hypothetical protein K2W97_01290 [Chthoniobacterales bacterium]|nr:hypothetical protein [Chthoniobacterales bacterium]